MFNIALVKVSETSYRDVKCFSPKRATLLIWFLSSLKQHKNFQGFAWLVSVSQARAAVGTRPPVHRKTTGGKSWEQMRPKEDNFFFSVFFILNEIHT